MRDRVSFRERGKFHHAVRTFQKKKSDMQTKSCDVIGHVTALDHQNEPPGAPGDGFTTKGSRPIRTIETRSQTVDTIDR